MYLLDTCAFLYYIMGSEKLTERALRIIETEEELYLSQVSLWEIAIKKTINKLEINESIADLERICDKAGIKILPIKNCYFQIIQELPMIHNDPFDRLIIATVVNNNFTLLTDDDKIRKYDISISW